MPAATALRTVTIWCRAGLTASCTFVGIRSQACDAYAAINRVVAVMCIGLFGKCSVCGSARRPGKVIPAAMRGIGNAISVAQRVGREMRYLLKCVASGNAIYAPQRVSREMRYLLRCMASGNAIYAPQRVGREMRYLLRCMASGNTISAAQRVGQEIRYLLRCMASGNAISVAHRVRQYMQFTPLSALVGKCNINRYSRLI